ncbi:MAG: RHS repeat-associated core domain-containing protein, partial [Myxococcaceae bacterium]
TSFLSVDGQGSVTDATSTSGSLTSARQYDAWGRYRNGSAPTPNEPKLGYTGHQYDTETGLIYARARYYDPELGRFLSRDTVEGNLNDAPSLNRYAYVKANPLRWTDPDGLFSKELEERIRAAGGDLEAGPSGVTTGEVIAQAHINKAEEEAAAARTPEERGAAGRATSAAYEEMEDARLSKEINQTIGFPVVRGAMYCAAMTPVGCAVYAFGSGSMMVTEAATGQSTSLDPFNGNVGTVRKLEGTDRVMHGVVGGLSVVAGGGVGLLKAGITGPTLWGKTTTTTVLEASNEPGTKAASGAESPAAPTSAASPKPAQSVGAAAATQGKTIGELRASGLKDAHHPIQDAAVRDLPGYDTNAAPGVQLKGPANEPGTPHYEATQAQRQAGGGTYAAERRIGYKA